VLVNEYEDPPDTPPNAGRKARKIGSVGRSTLLPMRSGLPARLEGRKLDRQATSIWGMSVN
jgi:hypothetical protein